MCVTVRNEGLNDGGRIVARIVVDGDHLVRNAVGLLHQDRCQRVTKAIASVASADDDGNLGRRV
jgi:hypothetical protein